MFYQIRAEGKANKHKNRLRERKFVITIIRRRRRRKGIYEEEEQKASYKSRLKENCIS